MKKLILLIGLVVISCAPEHLECITIEKDVYDEDGFYLYTEVSKERCYYTN